MLVGYQEKALPLNFVGTDVLMVNLNWN